MHINPSHLTQAGEMKTGIYFELLLE